MKNFKKFAAVAAATALALSACSSDSEEATTEGTTEETTSEETTTEETTEDTGSETEAGAIDYSSIDGSDYTACLVSDAGGWDDKSFNESAYNGIMDAQEQMGITVQTRESATEGDFQPNVDALVAEGCQLIIGVGFLLEPATLAGAQANPDLNFGLVDSDFTTEVPNGRPLLFNTAEAAYLAGYAAAGTTETGVVATFGGLPIPSVQIFMDGFYDGVMAYNEAKGENVQVLGWNKETQTGSFSNSFDDQAQGQQITEGFITQGADIVMPVAGPVGLGAASAAQSAGNVKIIGVDSDWYESAPEFSSIIFTSVLKDIDASVLDSVARGIQGDFDNTPYVGTLENGGVGIAPFHDFDGDVSDELKAEIEDLKAQIISGEIVVETPNAPVTN